MEADDRHWTTLGSFVSLQRGHDLTESERQAGFVPVVGSAGPNGFHSTAKAVGPGVAIGRSGASFGVATYCPVDYWPHNTVLYVTDFRGNDPRYVYYCMRSIDFAAFNSGSAQASLNRNYLVMIPVRVPPAPEQRAIAHILGTLDDKIELNRRMNETLEEMARALFKSWFVDFDPVRRKAEGRDPGLPKHLADLFPSRFVDSELGAIPEGWRVGTVADVGECVREGVNPADVPPETPYIGLEHMPQRSIALGAWDRAEQAQSQKTRFARGDILFGKLRPYFHKVGVAPIGGVCSTDIVVVRPRPSHFGIALGHLSSDSFVAFTNAGSDGTRMPRTSWARMSSYGIVLPPPRSAGALDPIVRPIVDRIHAGLFEATELAALRETLLPKLISGELRVKNAERIVGAAS